MLKFIVVSDLHLVPEGKLSHAIDTYARLVETVDQINARHGDAAFVIFAGDLADHGDPDAYKRLHEQLGRLQIPWHLTLGNHDRQETFLAEFGDDLLSDTGNVDAFLDAGGHRIIILDSSVAEQVEGRLDAGQIAWLTEALSEAADRPAIVVIHHNICDFAIPTDFINLKDPTPFYAALKSHPDLRMVISGHVHMSVAGSVQGIPFTAISGLHYNIAPKLEGPLDDVPRLEGPGQIAVVLAHDTHTVVHHENIIDRNQPMPAPLFAWDRDDA